MYTSRRALLGATTATVMSLTLAACGDATVSSADSEKSVEKAVAAVELAENEVGGVAFELDEEGKRGWDVSVVADGQVTEVRVNTMGTEVTKTESDGRIDADDRVRVEQATVPLADAITTAAKETTGTVSSVELDRFRVRTLVWEVDFDNGDDDVTVSVDAMTGVVANVDRD